MVATYGIRPFSAYGFNKIFSARPACSPATTAYQYGVTSVNFDLLILPLPCIPVETSSSLALRLSRWTFHTDN
jgi:hypothetical protein